MAITISGREFEPLAAHTRERLPAVLVHPGHRAGGRLPHRALGLRPGMRVLDVGCGPGPPRPRPGRARARGGRRRHRRRLSAAARRPRRRPARHLGAGRRPAAAVPGEFDAAISLCQGGFGLLGGDDDGLVLDEMAEAVRPGGRVAVTAFSAYFAVRYLEDGDTFDAAAGVNHERTEVRDQAGAVASFDLWTTCFTPRELRLLAGRGAAEYRALVGGARRLRARPPTSNTPSSCSQPRCSIEMRRTVCCTLPPQPLSGGAFARKEGDDSMSDTTTTPAAPATIRSRRSPVRARDGDLRRGG